jgi:hypothetical protein
MSDFLQLYSQGYFRKQKSKKLEKRTFHKDGSRFNFL